MEEDDETIIMLPDNMFVSLIVTDLRDKIIIATETDELATKIKDCLRKQSPPPLQTALSDWSLIDEQIIYKERPMSQPTQTSERKLLPPFTTLYLPDTLDSSRCYT